MYIPTTCTQCDQAWCAKICPTNAIVRDEDTEVRMRQMATARKLRETYAEIVA